MRGNLEEKLVFLFSIIFQYVITLQKIFEIVLMAKGKKYVIYF